jgi:hypothetical protein
MGISNSWENIVTENIRVARGDTIASIPGQHDGDCALRSGSISRFVQISQTARISGLDGQSPLPEDLRCIGSSTMATALCGRGMSRCSGAAFPDC